MNSLTFDAPAASQQISEFIRTTFQKTGKTQAVLALSGGIDSAVSLILTTKALSPASVHAYYMPSKTSRPANQEDAQAAAAAAGLSPDHFHILPIGSIIQKTWRIIKHYAEVNESSKQVGPQSAFFVQHPEPADSAARTAELKNDDAAKQNQLRLANITARIRMILIFDAAKKQDALVIGTENYSEHLLGYYTRFGDEASDIEPIRHLYKTQVIELAKYLEIPQHIIDKPASADLWPGQTDTGELGFTYEQADPILMLIDQRYSTEEIISQGYETSLVHAIYNQVQSMAFKHQVPYRSLNSQPLDAAKALS